MTIKILLVDDHKITRDGLRKLINERVEMKVIAEAENGREAVRFAEKFKPDVIVMDISMPELNGMEATRQIINTLPKTKVIIAQYFNFGGPSMKSESSQFDKVELK